MYNNYEGDYLEGFILKAKEFMAKSKKYQSFRLRLLTDHDIKSMLPDLIKAIDIIKIDNFQHYRMSRKYVNMENPIDILDKCLATDDILYNEETNETIAIDWTASAYKIDEKVEKHTFLARALYDIAPIKIVVCMQNGGLWEDLDEADLAKSLYKVLQLIATEVQRKDYPGFIIIDVKEII